MLGILARLLGCQDARLPSLSSPPPPSPPPFPSSPPSPSSPSPLSPLSLTDVLSWSAGGGGVQEEESV